VQCYDLFGYFDPLGDTGRKKAGGFYINLYSPKNGSNTKTQQYEHKYNYFRLSWIKLLAHLQ